MDGLGTRWSALFDDDLKQAGSTPAGLAWVVLIFSRNVEPEAGIEPAT